MTTDKCGMHHYPVIREGRCIVCIEERRKLLCPDGHKKIKSQRQISEHVYEMICENCGEVFREDSSG